MKGISIIVPTYNRQEFIEDAIQSVIEQDYEGNLEVIVSDDGSWDSTLEIAESFGNKVIILKKDKGCLSQGPSSTRNRGLKAATKPYIGFLDSDDFYLPDHLKNMTTVLENNPNLGFVFCRTLELKEVNGVNVFKPWTHSQITLNDILNPVVSRDHVVNTNCFLFKKSVFEKVGVFNENYSNGEDGDLWMRISEQFKGAFVDHYGVAYRVQHGAEQLTNISNEKFKKCSLIIHKNAIQRYHNLKLRSPFRIFSLKHAILHLKYSDFRFKYFLCYICLIFRYPLPFFESVPFLFSGLLRNKYPYQWKELSYYTGKEKNLWE